MKVLFIGGGRRVELAERFMMRGYEVFSYELNHNCPIADVATIIKGRQWEDTFILMDLLDVINSNKFDLVLPLQDQAVPLCAILNLPNIVTPSTQTANTCFDKKDFESFMLDDFPKLYPNENLNPYWSTVVMKPRFGYGSIGIQYIYDQSLKDYGYNPEEYILQDYISGKEYSVDAYFDRDGNYVDSIPRERIRISGGEVLISKTLELPELQKITKEVGEKLRMVGPSNFQYKIQNDFIHKNNRIYMLEVNCRFGGGWTFSLEAGLNAIRLIERDWLGIPFYYKPNQWKRNLLLERSYRDHYFEIET